MTNKLISMRTLAWISIGAIAIAIVLSAGWVVAQHAFPQSFIAYCPIPNAVLPVAFDNGLDFELKSRMDQQPEAFVAVPDIIAHTKDQKFSRFLMKVLSRSERQKLIEGSVSLLANDDPSIRRDAWFAIAEAENPRAIQELIRMARIAKPTIIREIVQLFAVYDKQDLMSQRMELQPFLLQTLNEEPDGGTGEPQMMAGRAAVKVLRKLHDDAAFDALKARAGRGDDGVVTSECRRAIERW